MWEIFKRKKENVVVNRKKKCEKSDKETLLKKSIRKLEGREVESVDTSLLSKGYKIDYNSLLNEEQKKALLSQEGQYLVIAGAGSGKTRTIVYRTAWLIENGIPEEKILMVTFTRKASEEMKERLREILKVEELKTTVTTFHSFCARLIFKHKNIFAIEELNILEEERRERLFLSIIEDYQLEKKHRGRFYSVEDLINKMEKARNRGLKIEEVFKEHVDDVLLVRSEYIKYKKIQKVYDFDDLIELVVKKFRENKEFLNFIRKKIDYWVVDEYQDSNLAQRELLKLLVGEKGNLMVVGDDYQSIYGFRGADFTNILKFGEDFPEGRLIKLRTNYRSSEEIIAYCNRIANKFLFKYDKTISGTGRKVEKVHRNSFKDEIVEGRYICEKILSLRESIPYEEIAILFRNKYGVKSLEKILKEHSIPYHTKDNEKKNGVALYSVHSSKGLEWEVVFIPTLLEGIFPSGIDRDEIEEEKRLYYVACSRAKNYLYLTYPKYHYEKLGYFDKKSKFLEY